jgi:hypothetical protein
MVEEGKLPLEESSANKEPDSHSPSLIETSESMNIVPHQDITSKTHLKVWVARYEEMVGRERVVHEPAVVYVSE